MRQAARGGTWQALSRFLQTTLASALLGLCAWLALRGELQNAGGLMIVASILGGRVLAPMVALIAQWRTVVGARDAWLRLAQLALFGAVNSMQFTAMNTLTLKDLGTGGASSGNSLFSLVQMLSMSLGVTVAGAILATFTGLLPRVTATIAYAVVATFVIVKVVDLILGIRISQKDEELGMDLAVHGEVAYQG